MTAGELTGPHTATATELKARLEAERTGRPFLVFRDADGGQQLVFLPDDRSTLSIGRDPACDLRIDWDMEASRAHAELHRVGSGWTVADGGLSRNGTYLNGERLRERRRLSDGDHVRCGRTSILYREPNRMGSASREDTVPAGDVLAPGRVSPAQRAVLLALCRPFADGDAFATPATNAQIAAELHLSQVAVKGHLRALFAKFGVDALPQNEKRLRLAERALHTGVIGPADLRERT